MKHKVWVSGTLTVSVLLLLISQSAAQKSLRIRVNRWISVQQILGSVAFVQPNGRRSAQVGDRLETVGSGITTGENSTARLLVDNGIGTISVSEKTQVWVQALDVAPDNGRITRLRVPQGQVRLKLRPFTNRGSRLEIQTPTGLSGVRGTEFGLTIQPNGKTGLATLQGAVVASAQGNSVSVSGGYQNFTIPGEPPSLPVPLRNDVRLQYQLRQEIDRRVRRIRLVGRVDAVNTVAVDGVPQSTDRNGRFSTLLYVPSRARIEVVVTTPLGKTGAYELALP